MTDYWEITEKWIAATLDKYKDVENLDQVFMRGPFTGWSEWEVKELAERLNGNNKGWPFWPEK